VAAVGTGRLGGSGLTQELGQKAFFFSVYLEKLLYFISSLLLTSSCSYVHALVLP
jgi:hypothetical protein